jgi:hypothetical protein
MARYYVDLASGSMLGNDGLTETGFYGWPEFYTRASSTGAVTDEYLLRNIHSSGNATGMFFIKMKSVGQWNDGSPWRIINTTGGISFKPSSNADISGGIIGCTGGISLSHVLFYSCFFKGDQEIEIGRSTISADSGVFEGCTIDVDRLYLPSNYNTFYFNNTIIKANTFTKELGANGNSAILNNVATNMSEVDFTSSVTVIATDTTYSYTLPIFDTAATITETGLAVRIPEHYGVYSSPSTDLFDNTRYGIGAVTPSSILFYIADPSDGVIESASGIFQAYITAPYTSGDFIWDKGDGSSTEMVSGVLYTGVFLTTGVFDTSVTFSGFNDVTPVLLSYTGIYEVFVSGYVEMDGSVEGQSYILSYPEQWNQVDGYIYGWGSVNGITSFIYPLTAEPPTSSGTLIKSIKPLLTNKARYPYRPPEDKLVSKIDFLKMGKMSYLKELPVELWLNYSGSWFIAETGVTDRYGSCYITHLTDRVPGITNCLGVVKVIYKDGFYVSNVIRYNFLEAITYIIDAGTCIDPGSLDRTDYNIYDATTSGTRDGYTIYTRPQIN